MTGICYNIVPLYFDRHLGLANGGLMAGSCVAQIVVAPFIRYLQDAYGYRGGVVIFGAIVLNAFVGVSLFHPLKWHMKTLQPTYTDISKEKLTLPMTKNQLDESPKGSPKPITVVQNKDLVIEEPKQADAVIQEKSPESETNKIQMRDFSANPTVSTDILLGHSNPKSYSPLSDNEEEDNDGAYPLAKRWSITLLGVVKTTISDMGILRLRRAIVIILSMIFSTSCHYSYIVLMPMAVQDKGHSLEDTAWIVSVVGIFSLVTRFIVSPASDWKRFSHRFCLMFGYALNVCAMFGM